MNRFRRCPRLPQLRPSGTVTQPWGPGPIRSNPICGLGLAEVMQKCQQGPNRRGQKDRDKAGKPACGIQVVEWSIRIRWYRQSLAEFARVGSSGSKF